MHHFHYHQDELYCEGIPLRQLAEAVGTPCYVYSHTTLCQHFRIFDEAFAEVPHQICFSAKSNSNIAILSLIGSLGGARTLSLAASCSEPAGLVYPLTGLSIPGWAKPSPKSTTPSGRAS